MRCRGLISFAAAFSVFWHAVAGCCAHHAHGETIHLAAHPFSTQSDAAGLHQPTHGVRGHAHCEAPHDCGSHSDSEHGPRPCPGHCHHGKCVFAAPKPANSTFDYDSDRAAFAVALAVLDVAPQTGAPKIESGADERPGPSDPLRRHLALGVLLL